MREPLYHPDLKAIAPAIRMRVYYTLFLLLSGLGAFAQQFPIQKLTAEEGLGHSIVYRTMQSSDGYLWFSTDNGLTRYDGANLRNFTSEDGLFSNFIFDMLEWNGKLYICTFGGGVMTLEGGIFKPLTDSLSNMPLYPLELEVYGGNLWIIDRFKRLFRFDGKKYIQIKKEDLDFPQNLDIDHYKFQVHDSSLYVASNRGLFAFDKDFHGDRQEVPTSTPLVFNVRKLRNGNLLIINWDQLIEFNPSTKKSIVLLKEQKFSRNSLLLEDSESNIWIATISGDLFFVDRSDENNVASVRILEGLVINDLFEDKEKNIWLSTYGEGAWCVQSVHIRNYPIKGCIVSDILVDRESDQFIVTTMNSGLRFFPQKKGSYEEPQGNRSITNLAADKINLISGLTLQNGSIIFSSDFNLFKWHNGKVTSTQTATLISSLFYQKRTKRIWIGGRFSLSYTDSLLQEVTPVPGFDDRVVRCMTEDAIGNILVGTDAGMFIHQGESFLPFSQDKKFSTTYFNALYREPSTGEIWAGTNGGLAKIKDGQLIFVDNPLTRARCNSITGDGKGNIWVGTVNGLLYINKDYYEMLTVKEGLAQSNIIRAKYDAESGILALLNPNALSMIEVSRFFPFSRFEIPQVIIEDATSVGKKVQIGDAPIVFSEGSRQINLQVSTPMIKNREKIQYSYRINDRPWTEFNGRDISLHSLPYGDLSIDIRAKKLNEPGAEQLRRLTAFVARPFYLRWWFITIMSLLGIASVLMLISFYSKKRSRKLEEENKRLDVEHKALRNLLNPHFLYNAINSIQAFILQNDQRQTLGYLSKFSQLVRLNLELLSKDSVTLDKELKNISLYLEFEKLRFAEKLKYTINIDPSVPQEEIQIPSFILQPFLENAIWHGLLPREEGGHLHLKVDIDQGKLHIIIEDDGIGINTSLKSPKPDIDKKNSMGINIIRERIELLRKLNNDYALTISDKAQLNGKATGTGTIVKITIPLEA